MALKHDAQGFLVGDPIDIGRALAVWDDIRNDFRAIRKAVLGVGESPSKPGHDTAKVERPTGRRGAGMEEADPAVKAQRSTQDAALLRPAVTPERGSSKKQGDGISASLKAPEKTAITPNGCDNRGRFVSGKPAGEGGNDRAAPDGENSESALRGVADRIASAVNGAGAGMEEADPAVKAFNEIAQPMARGYEMLTGGSEDKKQTGFLRRIFGTLNAFRSEESAFNKAANKSLKNLEAKPDDGKGGDSFLGKVLSQLVSQIPLLGTALTALRGLLAGGAGMLKGAGKGLLGGAMSLGKGALKKLPMIGTLIGAFSAWSESSDADNDKSLTDDERRGKKGAAWGGATGGAIGLAIGTVLGGPLGAIVGGVVGDWLGRNVGQIIGENFASISAAVSNGWNEIKVAALGTWDWIKGGWDDVVAGFSKVFEAVGKTWSGFVDSAKAGWDTIANLFTSAYEGLKSIPVIGPAIQAVEDAAKKTAAAASAAAEAAKAKAVEVGIKMADTAKSTAGAAWDGAKSVAASLVPEGMKNKVAARRAIETGADYKQGNIAGLDDTHTRALVASTAATESGGGKLDVVNSAGYMGRYQAGAGWLADAGQINGGSAAVKAAMKADGFTSEYKWGQSGGMTRFLKDDKNWANGMSYDKYLASADAQDAAFKANSDKSYQSLVKKGVITKDMSQDDIAGILKARHIAGEGGAARAARGEEGPADANGTTALKYKTDLAAGNIYTKTFSQSPAAATPAMVVATQTPAAPSAPVVASISSPPVVAALKAEKIAEAPPIVDTLASNSGASKKSASVTAVAPDAGQDLRDRRIAHIVTGGLSSA